MLKFISILFLFFSLSCKEDSIEAPFLEYINSYIVLNEGINAESTISSISKDFITFRENVFFNENKSEIGNKLISAHSYENDIYLILSGSNKIEIVNKRNFKSVASISASLSNPRYCLVKNEKLYVTNWGTNTNGSTNYLSIYNLADKSFIKSISLSSDGTVEQLYAIGNYLYVLNNGNGEGTKLSVINLTSESVETTITLSQAPDSATILGRDLYLLCSGKTESSGAISNEAEIWRITETTAKNIFDFDDLSGGQTAKFITSNNNNLYFVLKQTLSKENFIEGVYKIPVDGDFKDLSMVIDFNYPKLYNYKIETVHNLSILKDQIVLLETKNADLGKKNGNAYFYTTSGNFITSFLVGITPNFVFYNE